MTVGRDTHQLSVTPFTRSPTTALPCTTDLRPDIVASSYVRETEDTWKWSNNLGSQKLVFDCLSMMHRQRNGLDPSPALTATSKVSEQTLLLHSYPHTEMQFVPTLALTGPTHGVSKLLVWFVSVVIDPSVVAPRTLSQVHQGGVPPIIFHALDTHKGNRPGCVCPGRRNKGAYLKRISCDLRKKDGGKQRNLILCGQ